MDDETYQRRRDLQTTIILISCYRDGVPLASLSAQLTGDLDGLTRRLESYLPTHSEAETTPPLVAHRLDLEAAFAKATDESRLAKADLCSMCGQRPRMGQRVKHNVCTVCFAEKHGRRRVQCSYCNKEMMTTGHAEEPMHRKCKKLFDAGVPYVPGAYPRIPL